MHVLFGMYLDDFLRVFARWHPKARPPVVASLAIKDITGRIVGPQRCQIRHTYHSVAATEETIVSALQGVRFGYNSG